MGDKPSYLGLLNAIAVAEAEAEQYLCAWAGVTPREDVRQVLTTVALREGEHAKAFAKRVHELGFSVREKEDPKAGDRLAMAASTVISDREKFEKLGLGQAEGDGPDVFAGMFADKTIDIGTGALLGRYIAEERDSGRLLRSCYQQLCAADNDGASGNGAASADLVSRLEAIERRLDALTG